MRVAGPAATISLLFLLSQAVAGESNPIEGVWQQQGYGKLLEIRGDAVRIYDFNKIECHVSEETTRAELGEITPVHLDRLEVRYGLNLYAYDRLAGIPGRCRAAASGLAPLQNFDSLWHTMREHYAFFQERDIDWDAVYARYRPRVREKMSDVELFRLLHGMLESVDDGHVELEVPDALEEALPLPATPNTGSAAGAGRFELGEQAKAAIVRRYVDEPRQRNAGAVRWGLIGGTVGYVQVNHMLMLADYGVDPALDIRSFFGAYFKVASDRPYQYRDEVLAARALMARIVDDLKGTTAVIVDVRFNGGGKDEAALEFLRPFLAEPLTVFSKKARDGEGWTEERPIVLEPLPHRLHGRLYVLTSAQTASAAEIFVLASRSIRGSLRVGDTTEGVFSDSLDKTLPNGWEYTLSNEVYRSPAGEVFEGKGIPPDIRIPYPRDGSALYRYLLEAADDGDAAIEVVLAMEKQIAGETQHQGDPRPLRPANQDGQRAR